MSIYSLYPALRQPLTLASLYPLLLSYYAQTVLAILPNTFIFKLLLLPFILWRAWKCTVGLDFAVLSAQLFGHQSADKLAFWNFLYVDAVLGIALRSIEWTFTKSPLRRHELTKRNEDEPVERRQSASTVFLDAFELTCNIRGVGWSWSSDSFRGESMPSSIAVLFAKTLLKLTVFDAAQYIIQCIFPSVNSPKGGSIFDPSLPFVPRTALAAFAGICGGVWTCTFVDTVYHVSALVGRTLFRQPASAWPRAFNRPWMSTSIQEFWGFRWHQFMRHHFIVFGALPGRTLFGRPGAVMGAFALSAILHHIGLWGTGNGTEFITAGGFFLLMGIGVIIEDEFRRVTGLRVQGWLGWSWTMLWTTLWGTFMIDGWARHGVLATELLPGGFRPGKVVVDAIIALSSK